MTHDFLHSIAAPILLDAHECGDAASDAVAGGWSTDAGLLLALAAAAGVLWWGLRVLQRRGVRRTSPWTLAAVVGLLLIALPWLSLHAAHHTDTQRHQCAVAGIAHSMAGGALTAAPELSPPRGTILPPLSYVGHEARRDAPEPLARGPPTRLPSQQRSHIVQFTRRPPAC